MQIFSWRPKAAPAAQSFETSIEVSLSATDLNAALPQGAKIKPLSLLPPASKPRVVSIKIGRQAIKTEGFVFPESAVFGAPQNQPSASPSADSQSHRSPKTITRLAPPSDIIKLEDRLYYLLQPPLESLVAANSLAFPFEPFSYQYQGVAFLYTRIAAILADEMGLGKTMQAITAIRLLLCSGEIRNVLLICPKPLMSNWRREFQLWAPEIPLGLIEGDQARRRWQWSQVDTPVKIANYELLMRDRELLDDSHFDLMVLDEAQRIKNRSSATSQVVRSVVRSRSWALTGTPVENSPEDLVGIFEFLSPGYLSSSMRPRKLGRAASDYILRRTKEMVLPDLPPKMVRDTELELTPEQAATYQTAEDEGVLRLTDMGESITISHVFELVLRLKQICNFDPVSGASSKYERLAADLEEIAASGQKAIVFSQWVHTLKQLKQRLGRLKPLEYHGKIPSKRREAVIDQFKQDPSSSVILMSYGAGGVGLNLQFCGYVFLFDRWWNPAVEDQAINRAHRIGVTGPVTVTRMLTIDTIEERINQVLEEKRELFATVFSDSKQPKNAGFSQSEIFGLFNLRTPKGPLSDAA